MMSGMPPVSHSTRLSASRWYSRRHRPSTVMVTPRAPPSLVSPRETSAPAPTATPIKSDALLSSRAGTSTGAPAPPPSNQSGTSSPASFASVRAGERGGEVTRFPGLLLPPTANHARQADVRLLDDLLRGALPIETPPLGSDHRLHRERRDGRRPGRALSPPRPRPRGLYTLVLDVHRRRVR